MFLDRKDNFYINNGASGLYIWNDTIMIEVDSIARTLPTSGVYALCDDSKGNLYGGAIFDVGIGQWNVLKWNGKSWSSLGGTSSGMIDAWYSIYSLCTDKFDNVYAATIDPILKSVYIAKWDGTMWSRIDTISKLFGGYSQVLLRGDEDSVIYAAVDFLTSTGLGGVLKWDGHGWTEVGELRANGQIKCLVKDKLGNLYVAGYFSDNLGRTCVAKWDGVNWTFLGAGTLDFLPGSHAVRTLFCDSDNNLYAGGDFVDNNFKITVAKWDGFVWKYFGEAPATISLTSSESVSSIAKSASGTLYASGSFKNSVTKVSKIARYTTNITLSVDNLAIGSSQINLFPNPANNRVSLQIITNGEKNFQILLQSSDGLVLEKKILESTAGQGIVSFEVENLPSGTYLIVINDGVNSKCSKIVISH